MVELLSWAKSSALAAAEDRLRSFRALNTVKSTIINTLTASVSYFTDSSSIHQFKSHFTLSFLSSLLFDGAPVFDLL